MDGNRRVGESGKWVGIIPLGRSEVVRTVGGNSEMVTGREESGSLGEGRGGEVGKLVVIFGTG